MSKDVPQKTGSVKYRVLRSGTQVSDMIHDTMESAEHEKKHWDNIITRWPDGSKISVEEVRNK